MLFKIGFSIFTGEIHRISPRSVQMREDTDQKKLRIWHFSRSAVLGLFLINWQTLKVIAVTSGVKTNLINKRFDWKSKTCKDFLSFIYYLGLF